MRRGIKPELTARNMIILITKRFELQGLISMKTANLFVSQAYTKEAIQMKFNLEAELSLDLTSVTKAKLK